MTGPTGPVPTTCMRCAVGCGHVQQPVEKGYGLDIVRGDAAHPVNNGLACHRGIEETTNPGGEWLTRPLRREGDDLVPTSWGRALQLAGTALTEAIDRSPDSVAVLGSGQQTNEAAYALGKVARGGIGTRYYDANTTLCMASAVTAYYEAFGSDAPPPTYDDIPDAETHLVWGANPAVAHPVMFRWIRESAKDGTLIVVDPIESETADLADSHVAPDPGTDLALARAVLARLVETDRIDRTFIEKYTDGFDELLDHLPDPRAAAATAGVRFETVDTLAEAFERNTLIYWGMGVNQSTQGTDTARALIDLCLASGNLGPGSGPFSLTGQANSMGTRVCSSKGTWPGHRPFTDPEHRRAVADHWDVPVDRLPDDTGPGPVGIFDAADEIDVLWTVATNPAAGMPNAGTVRERLEETFVIAQDAFRSETVEYADIVFPAATWGESEGTVMNMERNVSRVRAASELLSTVRTDLELIVQLGEFVAPGLFDAHDPEGIFEEFVELTADTSADCSGISYARLAEEKAVRWPAPDGNSSGGYRYCDGVRTDETDTTYSECTPASRAETWNFKTDSGVAHFSSRRHGGLPEPPDENYPILLTTGRDPDRYNTGVRTRAGDDPIPPLRISSPTAEAVLGDVEDSPYRVSEVGSGGELSTPPATTDLEARAASAIQDTDDDRDDIDGRTVRVSSRRGEIRARIVIDDSIPDGIVWLPIHVPDVNTLTSPAVDPRSAEPALKQCAVRLTAASDTEEIPHVLKAGE